MKLPSPSPTSACASLSRAQGGAPLRIIDLFAGCGGVSLGFQLAGFSIVAGLERDALRARTHATNFHPEALTLHARARDVTSANPLAFLEEIGVKAASDIDIVVGGPPCQAYARVGRAKLREIARHPEAYLHDERGRLYAAWVAWIRALNPLAVVMENVPDILNYGGVNVGEVIADDLEALGYEVRYTLLNAAHYGVPQTRERFFLIGVHRSAGVVPSFPAATHRFDLPVGYRGTRAHAARWEQMQIGFRPRHAVLLSAPGAQLPDAVSCEEALGDLPVIAEQDKLAQKRGARDLKARQAYSSEPTNAYQRQMREWTGFESEDGASAHVIRALPRDYETFRRMKPGDDYPAALAVARAIFAERVASAPEPPSEGSPEWARLARDIIPPYDPDKFPNKWRKLEPDAPARTLMAHLSHDSYSHIHYDHEQARTISVREAARLQSFPDGFQFCGAMNAAFGQIGNAVPPLLAFRLAEHLKESLSAGLSHQQRRRTG